MDKPRGHCNAMADLYQCVPGQILRPFHVWRKDKIRNRKLIEWTGIFSGRNGSSVIRQNRSLLGKRRPEWQQGKVGVGRGATLGRLETQACRPMLGRQSAVTRLGFLA